MTVLPNLGDQLARVTTIGPNKFQPGKLTYGLFQDEPRVITVLNICCMYDNRQHQAERIDQNVSLATGNFLALVVTAPNSVWHDVCLLCALLFG